MAEYAHQVPEKYGQAVSIYRPRITSYHRRLYSALGPLLVAIGIIALMVYRRLSAPIMVILAVVAVSSIVVAYSVLKPSVVVKTETHLLRARLWGWQAVELPQIDHTVVAERLTPKKALTAPTTGVKSIRYKGIPGMWALSATGKKLMRLDGRIWDYKTLKSLATSLTPQTTVYPKINVTQMARQHPGLITFNELHPGWRSATIAIVSAIFILLLALAAALPEQMLRNFHLMG